MSPAHQPHTREGLSSLRTRVAQPGEHPHALRLGRKSAASPFGGRNANGSRSNGPHRDLVGDHRTPAMMPLVRPFEPSTALRVLPPGEAQSPGLAGAFNQPQNQRSPALSFHLNGSRQPEPRGST